MSINIMYKTEQQIDILWDIMGVLLNVVSRLVRNRTNLLLTAERLDIKSEQHMVTEVMTAFTRAIRVKYPEVDLQKVLVQLMEAANNLKE